MTPLTDAQLLRDYASTGSQAAFRELVGRHVHLVHAAALRQARGDAHLADDITQAVFAVLARRAKSIGDAVSITGWLINTTRYAAMSAAKLDARRRFHEQRATAMARTTTTTPPAGRANDHDALAATLDAALSRLRAKDRSAIALRYLQGKGVREVGEALGISQQAAQKRIGRALERLRDVLARHGVTTPTDVLEGNMSTLSLHVAPAALVSALVAGAAPAASASLIATATTHALVTAKLKIAAAGAAACLIVGAAAAPVVLNDRVPAPAAALAAAPSTAPAGATPRPAPPAASRPVAPAPPGPPLKLANASFFQNYNIKEFTVGVDAATVRIPGGEPAVMLTSDTPRWGMGGAALRGVDPAPFRGKRVRLSAYVKCEGLANWGSIWLFAVAAGERILANDDMGGRPLTKTTDWTRMEIVADIPRECDSIRCGLNLRGKGTIWMDSPQIEVVPGTVPITDDQIWHPWSFSMPHYSTKLDPATPRNGKPTRLLQSTVAGPGEWLSWDRNDRHPDKYLGKKMKLSMWIKTQNVTGPSGLLLRVLGPNFEELLPGLSKDQRTIRGTTDWTRYEFIADIPPDTQAICTGVRLGGKGKLWVDDVRYEVVE